MLLERFFYHSDATEFDMISYLSTFIIGTIFLTTGIAKALNSQQFIFHNYRYRLLPPKIVPPVAITFIGLECTLGVALLLHEFPQWLIPVSIILLLCLSALTIWSTSSGRTEDCGCYGGLLVITPKQSILLNLGYILLLGIALLYPVADHHTETWQWVISLLVGGTASVLAWKSQQKPLVDFSRLKTGNHWRRGWLKNSPYDLQQGSHFIIFLSKDCPYCKKWVPFLNVMNTQKNLPQAMGIMSLVNEELERFKAEQRVRFPLVSMDKLLLGYMVDAFPTAILIENGVISGKWEGEIPKEFLDKIKQSYENLILPKLQKSAQQDENHSLTASSKNQVGLLTESSVIMQQFVEKIQNIHLHTARYLQIDNFLSQEQNQQIVNYALQQQPAFVPTTTSTGAEDYRLSQVLFSFPEFSQLIENRIQEIIPDVLSKLELPSFRISQIESQLTAHNDGNYYKIHNDNSTPDTNSRVLTYVYYFYKQPKTFSGGELRLYDSKLDDHPWVASDSFQTVEPRNNSIVFFLSRYLHEVLPVSCPSQAFADSRFTINGWIRW